MSARPRKPQPILVTGQRWVPGAGLLAVLARGHRTTARWILALPGSYVIYSRGGVHHFECLKTTFVRWIRDYGSYLK